MPGPEDPKERGPVQILLVEDYFMVAEIYRSLLEELGYDVVGPAPSVSGALRLLEEERVDGAILDVNLQGHLVTPVAERLRELGVPFAFLTALMDLEELPEHFSDTPIVEKPAVSDQLRTVLKKLGVPPPS